MSRGRKAWTRDWPRNAGQKYRAATIPQAMKPKATLIPNKAWAGITNSFPKVVPRLVPQGSFEGPVCPAYADIGSLPLRCLVRSLGLEMKRREFLSALAGAAAAWQPVVARAQQLADIPRIGFLGLGPASAFASRVEALRQGMRDLGYIEGKNIVIEFR
jgi:hypothetical protein